MGTLATDALKTAIKSAYQNPTVRNNDPEASIDKLAELLADAMEAFVKSGTVTVTADIGGIVVAGSATTQNNPAPVIIEGIVE
jgi:hypothetical protein